jgi:hypothetical protein
MKTVLRLATLMVGDGVQVKYTEDDGVNVAHQVSPLRRGESVTRPVA